MDIGENMIENVDSTKMIRRVLNVEKTGFCDVCCRVGALTFLGCFWTLTFLVNLLLNVNMLLTSPTLTTSNSSMKKPITTNKSLQKNWVIGIPQATTKVYQISNILNNKETKLVSNIIKFL